MQNTVAPKSLADAIRKFVFDSYVVRARAEGHDEVVLRAGDVHRDMRLESRMPAVCSAIGPKFEAEYGVKVLDRAGPAQGANVYFRLLVRPAAPHPRIAAITQVAGSVSSPQRDAGARLPTPDPSATGSAIWLVSCVSEKRTDAAMAKDLYISDWFTKARRFVERRNAHWFILSAKHGLLRPDEIIPPYEQTLTDMSVEDRRAWGRLVLGQFTRTMPGAHEVAILAGMRYREFLVEPLRQQGVKAHCLVCNAPLSLGVASFNMLPTGVDRRGRRWGRSAWRRGTSWWLRWRGATRRAAGRSGGGFSTSSPR